jgi:hypothetical protein
VTVEEYSSASHPAEMQMLVKEGYGLALVREGTVLDDALMTRRLLDVDWTVDSAIIYRRDRYPKTIPVVIRRLRRMILRSANGAEQKRLVTFLQAHEEPSSPKPSLPVQLPLLR